MSALPVPAAARFRPPDPPLRIGSVQRHPLPDGRVYPRALAAHQFNAKHVALLESRIEQVNTEPLFLLAGRPLTLAERAELIEYLQRTLLPEVFDPDFDGTPVVV